MSTLVYNAQEIAPRELKPALYELDGISRETIEAHYKLYQGYVNKRNEILGRLAEIDLTTANQVYSDVRALKGAQLRGTPQVISLSDRPAFKIVYRTVSAPNPVTGKRVTLSVDRYYVWKQGRRAVLDLGCPVGVDNVDAYRLISESFRWS